MSHLWRTCKEEHGLGLCTSKITLSPISRFVADFATSLKWTGLTFKAENSRRLVFIKGRSIKTTPFSVLSPTKPSDYIPSIHSIHFGPVKFLGTIIDGSISNRKLLDDLEKKTIGWSTHYW